MHTSEAIRVSAEPRRAIVRLGKGVQQHLSKPRFRPMQGARPGRANPCPLAAGRPCQSAGRKALIMDRTATRSTSQPAASLLRFTRPVSVLQVPRSAAFRMMQRREPRCSALAKPWAR